MTRRKRSTGGGGSSNSSVGSGSSSGSSNNNSAFTLTNMIGGQVKPMKPKEKLLDVIKGLRMEQMRAREAAGSSGNSTNASAGRNLLDEIKSNFRPKAEIPSAVPKLPTEYIHRHRLMKQVVNCLLDRAGPRDTDDDSPFANALTCITSLNSDKVGNGKTDRGGERVVV